MTPLESKTDGALLRPSVRNSSRWTYNVPFLTFLLTAGICIASILMNYTVTRVNVQNLLMSQERLLADVRRNSEWINDSKSLISLNQQWIQENKQIIKDIPGLAVQLKGLCQDLDTIQRQVETIYRMQLRQQSLNSPSTYEE